EINPLQDHEERKQLFRDLLALPKFKDEAQSHIAEVDKFREDVLPQINQLLDGELQRLAAFTALQGQDERLIGQVKQLYTNLQEDLRSAAQDIADAMASEVPLYSGATGSISQVETTVESMLNNVINVGDQIAAKPADFSPAVADYFTGAKQRYADLLDTLRQQKTRLDALPKLSFDDIVRDLRADTGNALLVLTDKDARVVPFREVWPPRDPRNPSQSFKDREFQGEQKLTSAILQLTQTEKPAVIFVRHGGQPLLGGGFMPGQPRGAYEKMKDQLEDANFSVHEWDLATENEPPKIDPAPSRKIFVVLRPAAAPPSMPGQPPQSPPFTPQKLEILKKAMGDNPRALFLAGFRPNMQFGMTAMPATYEFNDYLTSTWGIEAPCDRVLLYAEEYEKDKYHFVRAPLLMTDCRFADVPITKGLSAMRSVFPMVSPLHTPEKAPDGVTTTNLAWLPEDGNIWSVGDISPYVKQQGNEFIVRAPGDYSGDFTIAMSATKGEGKVVVISSDGFATDDVALAPQLVLTSQGLATRPQNPGNAALFVNSLHWLNDNIKWMNLGTPIDASTLTIQDGSTALKVLRVFCVAILPALALCGGIGVWMARRR
ncbi:MAG TPA: hypothetical protein P5572_19575, partial [Phycisphaerae bacterium]|nr:hypothetical protein [Phycisphaerae bacterium]